MMLAEYGDDDMRVNTLIRCLVDLSKAPMPRRYQVQAILSCVMRSKASEVELLEARDRHKPKPY